MFIPNTKLSKEMNHVIGSSRSNKRKGKAKPKNTRVTSIIG